MQAVIYPCNYKKSSIDSLFSIKLWQYCSTFLHSPHSCPSTTFFCHICVFLQLLERIERFEQNSVGILASTLLRFRPEMGWVWVSGRLIKTRESFVAHAAARRGNEFKSVSERLPTRAGALVTPPCTVSAVTTPPALYYESNLSRREATFLVRGYLTPELIACSRVPRESADVPSQRCWRQTELKETTPSLIFAIREPDRVLSTYVRSKTR